MRGFIITSGLFIALIVTIIFNYGYVNKVHNDMHQMVAELSNEPTEENTDLIQKLIDYWEKKNILLSVSVSFREIDNLSNALDSLYAANKSEDIAQFMIYKELAQNAIDAIMRLERFTIDNIF